jgi:hypothetical protein
MQPASPDLASAPPRLDSAASPALIASLSRLSLPLRIDEADAALADARPRRGADGLRFGFCFGEIPCRGRTERRGERSFLILTAELGFLPYSFEAAARRRRLLKLIAAGPRQPGMKVAIAEDQSIAARGEVDLGPALVPAALLTGIVTLLLDSRAYLELIVAVAGEA